MSNKLWYNWREMRRDVNTLCREIILDNFNPDVIVGLSRGGLTPGVMMSHWFQKPFKPVKAALRDFPDWEDYLPKKTDKRVLIVDDIADSGKTLKEWSNYRTAVLHYKPHSSLVEPTIYATKHTTDDWIIYPWEREDSQTIQDYKLDN